MNFCQFSSSIVIVNKKYWCNDTGDLVTVYTRKFDANASVFNTW